jgi:hypothetical protein
MPAKSKAQQKLAAIAKHHPEKVHAKNKGILDMPANALAEYADTKRKGLPAHTKKSK